MYARHRSAPPPNCTGSDHRRPGWCRPPGWPQAGLADRRQGAVRGPRRRLLPGIRDPSTTSTPAPPGRCRAPRRAPARRTGAPGSQQGRRLVVAPAHHQHPRLPPVHRGRRLGRRRELGQSGRAPCEQAHVVAGPAPDVVSSTLGLRRRRPPAGAPTLRCASTAYPSTGRSRARPPRQRTRTPPPACGSAPPRRSRTPGRRRRARTAPRSLPSPPRGAQQCGRGPGVPRRAPAGPAAARGLARLPEAPPSCASPATRCCSPAAVPASPPPQPPREAHFPAQQRHPRSPAQVATFSSQSAPTTKAGKTLRWRTSEDCRIGRAGHGQSSSPGPPGRRRPAGPAPASRGSAAAAYSTASWQT